MACNFKCIIATEGLFKVTGSEVYTVHVAICRMLLLQTTNRK